MKTSCLIFILLLSISCFGVKKDIKKSDPIFQRHIISVSMTNGLSDAFYNSVHGPTEIISFNYNPNTRLRDILLYKPSFITSTFIKYSFGISELLRLESGIGFTLQGQIYFQGQQSSLSPANTLGGVKYTNYYGSLTIPVHVVIQKHFSKGLLIFKFGPNFNSPIVDVYRIENDNIPSKPNTAHRYYSTSDIATCSSLGFDFKIGYELQISKSATIDIGPLCNFTNLVFFHRSNSNPSIINDRQLFRYYVGADIAFNFGLKKAIVDKQHGKSGHS